jgi:hypothetical protein
MPSSLLLSLSLSLSLSLHKLGRQCAHTLMSCCIIIAIAAESDAGNLIPPPRPCIPSPFLLYSRTQTLAAVKSVIIDFIKEMNDWNAAAAATLTQYNIE